MMRTIAFYALVFCFAGSAAQAQLSSSPTGFNPAGNYTLSGSNTSSGLSSVVPSSAECPSGAGVLTPAHNYIRCTLTGNITIAPASPWVDGTFFRIQLIQDATGGRTAKPSNQAAFIEPSGLLNSDGTFAISTNAGAISELSFHTAVFSSTNYMVYDSVSAGLSAYIPYTHYTWGGMAGSGTSSVTLNRSSGSLTTGDCVFIVISALSQPSVSDGSNTYTAGPNIGAYTYTDYLLNATGGPTSITLSGTTIYSAIIDEFSGCGSSLDGSNSAVTASGTPAAGSFTTTTNGDLIWTGVVDDSSGGRSSYDPDTSPAFTGLNAANSGATAVSAYTNNSGTYRYVTETEWLNQPTAGAINPSFIAGTSTDSHGVVAIAVKHQ